MVISFGIPTLFRKIVPICGGANINHPNIDKIVKLDIYAYHAEGDSVIPVEYSRNIVNKLKEKGSTIKYTEYGKSEYFFPNSHFAWIPAYNDEKMKNWLFSE